MSVALESEKQLNQIGVYRLDEEIGSGAMGKVYRATHRTLGKSVAVKLVHADDPTGEVAARFLQEGIAASRIRHPNVVEILDAGKVDGVAYMAMQLLEGETLAECLSRQGRVPPTYAVDLILPVCAALIAAHDAGVLHRDLKPGNIFLNEVGRGDPEPMLLDFGISKILGPVDPELTQNPRFLGTPLYIAPEQADGATGSPRSDQYSLALTLYETLLGVRPFARYASSLIQLLRHVAEGDIRRPSELDASIPDELDITLCRALSVDPQDRFGSVREFGAALLPFASEARRTLWQRAFVDAERTMTSANAPVSDSKSSRRTHISVESSVRTSVDGREETTSAPGQQDFLTHSSLFGNPDSSVEADDEYGFDPAQSSVSRRFAASRETALDPYPSLSNERLSGNGDADPHSPSGDRSTLNVSPIAPAPAASAAVAPVKGRRFWFWLAVSTVSLGGLAGALLSLNRADETQISLRVSPATAQVQLDGKVVGIGGFERLLRGNAVHRLRVSAPGYQAETYVFQDDPPPRYIALLPLASLPADGNGAAVPVGLATSEKARPVPAPAKPLNDEGPLQDKKLKELVADPEPTPSLLARSPAVQPTPPRSAPTPLPSQSSERTTTVRPSDPAQKPLSMAPQTSSDQDSPPAPLQRPSIQTGNLDPWAP